MGTRYIKKHGLGYTPTLDGLVVALCRDYERRRLAREEGAVSKRTSMEYGYINAKIYEAAAEIVGERYAELYIDEIGKSVGYAKTKHDAVSETTYKEEKLAVKISIAEKLHLIG